MKISVFGMGYVGVVTSACLARLGHSILGIDIAEKKVELIESGNSPVVEAGIDQLVREAVENGRFKATTKSSEAIDYSDAIIVCVGTPSYPNGEVNLTSVLKVASEIAELPLTKEKKPVVVFRSTMPPGTMENVIRPVFTDKSDKTKNTVPWLVYHPEFLREGSALEDFFNSPQIVVASVNDLDKKKVREFFHELYKGIDFDFDIVQTHTAEMIKYVNNTFHASKVAFSNEIGRICRALEVDTHELFKLFFRDKKLNISSAYLKPGFAFGGSCLPKELRALSKSAIKNDVDVPLITSIERSNYAHIDLAFSIILNSECRKIGFLGLSFKPGTDDVRGSPFVKLVEQCLGKGFEVRIFDKSIDLNSLIGKNLAYLKEHISHITERLFNRLDDVIEFSDILILCHPEKMYLDALADKKKKLVLDLTGKFRTNELSKSKISIIVSNNKS